MTIEVQEPLISEQRLWVNTLMQQVHKANEKWWIDLKTGEKKERNFGEAIALIHSELSEALEGNRKGLQDDHLPNYKSEEVELADALIRIFDLAGGLDLNLGDAFAAKMIYNSMREDHKMKNRKLDGGKKY